MTSKWLRWLILATGLGVIIMVTAGYFRPMSLVAGHLFSDDAFYYFNIARNVLDGHGQSFDRITLTNGFHPLWLYVLVGYFGILKLIGIAWHDWPRYVPVLQIALWLVAIRQLWRIFAANPHASRFAIMLGLLMLVSIPWYYGMESGIASAFLAIALTGLVRSESNASSPSRWWIGVAFALMLLARLDTIFLLIAVGLVLLVRHSPRSWYGRTVWTEILPLAIPPMIALSLYMASNVVWFDGLMPISGALKTNHASPPLAVSYVVSVLPTFARLGLTLSVLWWMMRPFARKSLNSSDGYLLACDILSLSTILHFAHTAIFMDWAIFPWHFFTYNFTAIVIIGTMITVITHRRDVLVPLWAAALVLLAGVVLFQGYRKFLGPREPSWQSIAHDAGVALRVNSDSDAVFYMKDCGIFGYFSDRAVINGDGLVNDLSYQEYLGDGRLSDYLNDQGADYVVQHAFPAHLDVVQGEYDTYTYIAYSQLYNRDGGSAALRRNNEVYRSIEYVDDGAPARLIVWRRPNPNQPAR